MCVIAAYDKKRPVFKDLQAMEEHNADGGGIAWVEGDKVHWKKGIESKEVFNISKSVNLPFVIHFRIASVGGALKPLCHPFPIRKDASLDLEGKTNGVLFHNGHWSEWKETALNFAVSNKIGIPGGPWSDSRAMAWLAAHAGTNILNFIDEKICVLSGRGIKLLGQGWTEREGMYLSNTFFESIVLPWEYKTDLVTRAGKYFSRGGFGNDYDTVRIDESTGQVLTDFDIPDQHTTKQMGFYECD